LRTDLDFESEVFALPPAASGLTARSGSSSIAMALHPSYDAARLRLHDLASAGDNLAQHALALSRRSVAPREPLAARLARSRSEFRADQRAAQRLLLILQFAQ
jgi:hypothetical protein